MFWQGLDKITCRAQGSENLESFFTESAANALNNARGQNDPLRTASKTENRQTVTKRTHIFLL